MYSKSIVTEAVFPKVKMNYDLSINFLQNSPLIIQKNYSSKFSIGHGTFETPLLIWCEAALLYFF